MTKQTVRIKCHSTQDKTHVIVFADTEASIKVAYAQICNQDKSSGVHSSKQLAQKTSVPGPGDRRLSRVEQKCLKVET